MKQRILLTIGCGLFCLSAPAEELLYWDTFPIEGGIEGPTTYVSTFAVDGIDESTLALGPGITPRETNDSARFQGENFDSITLEGALADGDYFEFDITPADGTTVNATELMVTLRNRGGSTEERTIAIMSSQDGFTTPAATFLLPAGNSTETSQPVIVDISSMDPITAATTIRIVAYFAGGLNDTRTHPLTIGYNSDNELTSTRALLVSGELSTSGTGESWMDYSVDTEGWANTGAWLGWVNVTFDPWIWSTSLDKYIYISDDSGWVFAPAN